MENDQIIEKHNHNKWLIIVLSLLCLIIVGLIISIIIVTINNNHGTLNGPYNSATSRNKENYVEILSPEQKENANASSACDEIESRYVSEDGYTYEDAVADLKTSVTESENITYRIAMNICYANFVNEQGGDLDRAIEIMESMINKVKKIDQKNASSYYSLLIHLYEEKGNTEMVEYYRTLISNSIQEGTVLDEG